jgi:hypothetical protein
MADIKKIQDRVDEFIEAATGKKTFNEILDGDRRDSQLDLLQYIPQDHIMRRYSEHISWLTHIPKSSVFLMGLAAFNSIACRKYAVCYEYGDPLPLGLYAIAEHRSGLGKDRVMNFFINPFKLAATNARKAILKNIEQIESYEHKTDDDLEQLKALKKRKVVVFATNATPESLDIDLDATGGFFSALSCEQGLIDSITGGSYGNGRSNNNDTVLFGYSGAYVASTRATRKAYIGHAVGAFVSFAQPGSIDKIMKVGDGVTGYSQRFLFLSEPDKLGTRNHHEKREPIKALEVEYAKYCDFAQGVFENPVCFDDVLRLNISEIGHYMINEARNRFEPDLKPGGVYSSELLAAAVCKMDMAIMKTCAGLHLTSSRRWSFDIDNELVLAAVNIEIELLHELLKIARDKGFVGKKAEFTAVLSLFEKDQRPRTERNIIQAKSGNQPFKNFTGNKAKLIRETLEEMLSQGLLKVTYTVDNVKLFSLGQ